VENYNIKIVKGEWKLMKKRILPNDYGYSYSGIVTGVCCIFGVFMFLVIVNNTSHPIKISEWAKAAIPITAFMLILIAIDLYHMRKIRVLRKQRCIIMKKKPVSGEIVDIKRFKTDWRGNFTDSSGKGSRYVYQLVVSYLDPNDGKEKTALSEYYLENLYTCLSDNRVDVYVYGDNGYVVVDGLRVRKFGERKLSLKNHEPSYLDSDISFYMDIYGGWLTAIMAVPAVILLIVFLKIMNGVLRG
jgi:hypothetical protein